MVLGWEATQNWIKSLDSLDNHYNAAISFEGGCCMMAPCKFRVKKIYQTLSDCFHSHNQRFQFHDFKKMIW